MFHSNGSRFAVAVLAWFACSAFAQKIVPSPQLAIDQNRTTVVERIVGQWGDALYASNAGIGAAELRQLLSAMRSDHLLAASLAGTLNGLRDVMANALVATSGVSHNLIRKSLGDTGDDLVYTPVVPCRIVDTRNAGGAIGANSSRDFKVWVSSGDFTAQGGSATNCNIPPDPVGVVLNITAVSPAGAGNFIAYPTGSPTFTSVLNYQSGENALANGAIVPTCVPSCTNQLTIATNGAGADAVVDIAGYFKRPTNYGGTHIITGTYAVDSGGQNNTSSGFASTVAGGNTNTASGAQSTVGGGVSNAASGFSSTVAGGFGNTASDTAS